MWLLSGAELSVLLEFSTPLSHAMLMSKSTGTVPFAVTRDLDLFKHFAY